MVSPERVTVNVNGVLPVLPSALLASVAAIAKDAPPPAPSSLSMVPVAAAVAMVVPALGADSVTVKPSLASTVVSPATLMVTSWLVWPAAKLTVPVGNTPPVKSAALAGIGAAAGDGVGRRRCAGGVARAGDREGERRTAGVALGLACSRRRDRQRSAGGAVVVQYDTGCGSGGDGGSSARRRQRDGKALVGLHRGVAGDVDGDELAGLAGREADRPGRERAAGEVGSVGRIGAAAGDGVGRRRCAGGVARAGDREGERRTAGVALGLACSRRRDRQRSAAASAAAYTEHGKRVQFGVIDIAGRASAWSNLNRQRAVGDRDEFGR